ncbi:MAG TPA: alpha-amylase family glycosyl hydrolase [Candidatus Limnocylindria bacterium]|nr:alpha-amylase family glycosyl hydrolase [Candidatus Limnocylindria bacterium]
MHSKPRIPLRALGALCALLVLLSPLNGFALTGAVYEVFVRSFFDADGDGLGDLRGVTEKLPYIQSLGVSGIWLMPIHPSPSYHKYDVLDYKAVDTQYGTLEDFDALAVASDKAGLSLILDLVVNHTSSEHPWFLSALGSLAADPCGREPCAMETPCRAHNPYTGYYSFSRDGRGHPAPGAPGWTYEGQFGSHMPDLNLDNPLVRREIADVMAFWLGRGADGFRLDAVLHYYEASPRQNAAFLAWLNAEAKRIKPSAYIVAEAWTDASLILSYYGSGIDSLFDFPLANAGGILVKSVLMGTGASLARRNAEWSNAVRAAHPGAKNAPFIANHDMGRAAGMLRLDTQKGKVAAAAYLLLPGVPFIYYGEELGMTGSGIDENKRLPMLWSALEGTPGMAQPPPEASQRQRLGEGVAEQEGDPDSLLHFYRGMLRVRAGIEGALEGEATAVDYGDPAVMAIRYGQGKGAVTVVQHFGPAPAVLQVPQGTSMPHAWDTGGGLPALTCFTVTLAPYSGCVLISP